MTLIALTTNRRRALTYLGLGAGLMLALAGLAWSFWPRATSVPPQTTPRSTLALGIQAPDFEATMLDGRKVRLSQLRGHPVWLNFWGSWCAPCRAEMPSLVQVGQEAKAKGVTLVAIDAAEPRDEVAQYLRENGYTSLPVALDPDGAITSKYKLVQFPTHVFIDSNGRIEQVQLKPLSAAQMRAALEQLK